MKHIVLAEEITETKAAEIIQEIVTPEEFVENNLNPEEKLKIPKKEKICLYIDSVGGDIDSAVAIFNVLKNCGKHITTFIIGRCQSAGIMIAIAGHKRYALENTSFMIHKSNVGFEADVQRTEQELKVMLDESRQDDRKMFKIISQNSRISVPQIYKFIRESKTKDGDWYFGPIVAKKYGIIQSIGWPSSKEK
jgi:ATP-dependent Clp protease, protease subunit